MSRIQATKKKLFENKQSESIRRRSVMTAGYSEGNQFQVNLITLCTDFLCVQIDFLCLKIDVLYVKSIFMFFI